MNKKIFLLFPYFLISLIFILAILILSITKRKIRVSSCDFTRIGSWHHIDWFLSECKYKKEKVKIFCFSSPQSTDHINIEWIKIWSKKVVIISEIFLGEVFFYLLNKLNLNCFIIPKYSPYYNKLNHFFFLDKQLKQNQDLRYLAIESNSSPNIAIAQDDVKNEKKILSHFFLKKKKYICFHNRDDFFLNKHNSDRDWSYHNYRDASVLNYTKAIDYINSLGLHAVRMGREQKERIPIKNNQVIDYAFSNLKSDSADIYLIKNCLFFLGSDSGITIIPEVFRIPMLYVNFSLFFNIFSMSAPSRGRIIFKRISDNSNNLLSLEEMFKLKLNNFNFSKIMKQNKLSFIENTQDDIFFLVKEYFKHDFFNEDYTKEEIEMQKYFFQKYYPDIIKKPPMLTIGKYFLKSFF